MVYTYQFHIQWKKKISKSESNGSFERKESKDAKPLRYKFIAKKKCKPWWNEKSALQVAEFKSCQKMNLSFGTGTV